MHVHIFNKVSLRPANTWFFPLFVANGVLAVREVCGRSPDNISPTPNPGGIVSKKFSRSAANNRCRQILRWLQTRLEELLTASQIVRRHAIRADTGTRIGCSWPYVNVRHTHSAGPKR